MGLLPIGEKGASSSKPIDRRQEKSNILEKRVSR
jgi:hypothetical protein